MGECPVDLQPRDISLRASPGTGVKNDAANGVTGESFFSVDITDTLILVVIVSKKSTLKYM
jgi:hypothetical protein